MSQLVGWLSSNTAVLSILGAAVAFIWSTAQQVAQRKHESREREFQAFHKLVKELVSSDSADGVMWIDRQAAVAFELRHFPRYYEFTQRMLLALKEKWKADQWPRLVEEIDLTLKHIQQKK
ncbi:MAG: hypothetical protein LAO22_12735 [Acidobacteriia bacterium]|nr:hypothetical protein [Terriglobia bacterium]